MLFKEFQERKPSYSFSELVLIGGGGGGGGILGGGTAKRGRDVGEKINLSPQQESDPRPPEQRAVLYPLSHGNSGE